MRSLTSIKPDLRPLAEMVLRNGQFPACQRSSLPTTLEDQWLTHHREIFGVDESDHHGYFNLIVQRKINPALFGHKKAQKDPSRVYAVLAVAETLLSIEDGKGKPYTVEEDRTARTGYV